MVTCCHGNAVCSQGFDQIAVGKRIIFVFYVLTLSPIISGVLKGLVSGAFLLTDKDCGPRFKVRVEAVGGVLVGFGTRKCGILDKNRNILALPNSVEVLE